MIVLRGATSQWKRSRSGSLPDRAGGGAAAHTAAIAASAARIALRSSVRIERAQARLVDREARGEEALGVRRDDRADVDELAALDARHDADDRVVIRAAIGHGRPPRANARGGASRASGSRRRRRAALPCLRRAGRRRASRRGSSAVIASMRAAGQRRAHGRVGSVEPGRERQQHVVLDRRERARRALVELAPMHGGSRAPRRGRSARGGRARRACWCCAACGRRWSRRRRTRRCATRARRRAATRADRTRPRRAGSRARG